MTNVIRSLIIPKSRKKMFCCIRKSFHCALHSAGWMVLDATKFPRKNDYCFITQRSFSAWSGTFRNKKHGVRNQGLHWALKELNGVTQPNNPKVTVYCSWGNGAIKFRKVMGIPCENESVRRIILFRNMSRICMIHCARVCRLSGWVPH